MEISKIILEYLRLFISWPFLIFILLIVFRKEISRAIGRISERIKSADIIGSKIEFAPSIEEDIKIASTLEKIEQQNPGSLKTAGLDDRTFDEYRRKIKDTIRLVQKFLKERGYYTGDVDGIPGKNTKNAVLKFQEEVGLNPDGLIGPLTIKKILELQ
jgi:Putative peptidoglycan binding domain